MRQDRCRTVGQELAFNQGTRGEKAAERHLSPTEGLRVRIDGCNTQQMLSTTSRLIFSSLTISKSHPGCRAPPQIRRRSEDGGGGASGMKSGVIYMRSEAGEQSERFFSPHAASIHPFQDSFNCLSPECTFAALKATTTPSQSSFSW